MRCTHVMAVATVAGLAAWVPLSAAAAPQEHRFNDKEVRAMLDRIKDDANRFEHSLDDGVDKSPMNGTWEEDEIKRSVEKFEEATDRLNDRFREGDAAAELVREVLRRGAFIDSFVMGRPVGTIAQRDWQVLRSRLDDLAVAYGVRWDWTVGGPAAVAPARRLTDDQLERVVKSLEDDTDRFRKQLDRSLDDGPADGSAAEHEADVLMKSLDEATDRLRDRVDDERHMAPLVGRVLRAGERMDDFVQRHRLTPDAQADWARVRAELRELASSYGLVTWIG